MRVEQRDAITLHAEIVDCIEPGSIICTDGWAAYKGIMPTRTTPGILDPQGNPLFKAHFTVIHNHNFVDPPRNLPPMFRRDILPECRDMQHQPQPQGPLAMGMLLPFRCHTQRVERQWRELRETVKSSRDIDKIDFYIGKF